jgi:hypothetical protein
LLITTESHTIYDFIFKCFFNNANFILLVAHFSNVLQPLVGVVIDPVKNAYHQELNMLGGINDATHLGKITLILCYHKARKPDLTSKNIIADWNSSVLSSVSVAKPLSNTRTNEPEECLRPPSEVVAPLSGAIEYFLQIPKSLPQLIIALKYLSYSIKDDLSF